MKRLIIFFVAIFALHAQCDFGTFKNYYTGIIESADDAMLLESRILALCSMQNDKEAYENARLHDADWRMQSARYKKNATGEALNDNKIDKRILFLQQKIDLASMRWDIPC